MWFSGKHVTAPQQLPLPCQVQEWRKDMAQVQGKAPLPKMGEPNSPRRSVSPDSGVIQVLKGRDATSKLLIPS